MCGFLSYSEILTKERFFLKDVDFCLNEVDVFSEQCFFYGPVVVTWKTLIFLLACYGVCKKIRWIFILWCVYVLKKDVDLLYLINIFVFFNKNRRILFILRKKIKPVGFSLALSFKSFNIWTILNQSSYHLEFSITTCCLMLILYRKNPPNWSAKEPMLIAKQ